ncbi:putative transferase CAF17, mitochondrial isoform X2 [Armigeres subalbatus]|uniref:putative transferase CAF17, mitochondrial isoform X2 n=1 Tax=Armigeres subalbatus TaxID=124917 RepID=UPI002ED2D092
MGRNSILRIQLMLARNVPIQNVHQRRWLGSVVLEPLKKRSVLSVQGSDAIPFMQGLITNDMTHFARGSNSIYAMFLNTSGRVMYDSLIYKSIRDPDEHFFIECDTSTVDQLAKHLNLFRVRKKVQISKPDLQPWVAFTNRKESQDQSLTAALTKGNIDGAFIYKDPRLEELGYRILVGSSTGLDDLKAMFPVKTVFLENGSYVQHRYGLGIGEGVENHPPGKCFPLENNSDYLHGVSFHKGCYIGQELTARTHHTGVVRKRLMPLVFDQPVREGQFTSDAEIKTKDGQPVGKLRGYYQTVGIGLLRVEKVLSNQSLIVGDTVHCTTNKPDWWPTEQPKKH